MRIALLGDIALFGKNTARSRDWRHRFLGIRDILHGCDFVIGNLETPLTAGTRTVGGKSAYIKGFPEDAEILKYLGVSHVSLANNHIFDYGARGLSDTVSCLEQNGIAWYGINGKSIELGNCAVLSGFCCYSTNAAGLDRRTDFVNLLDPPEMEKAIRQAEEKNLLPILSCHWGEEHVHFPNYDHVELARALARKHTIVVHGTHPHVIQGTETVGESLIHYSLGNFCFDDVYTSRSKDPLIRLSLDNQESYVLILDIDSGRRIHHEIVPFCFAYGDYEIDNAIPDRMREWSSHLDDDRDSYIRMRNALLQEYALARKRSRDFNWYWKRLNPESVKMIRNVRRNKRRYREIMNRLPHMG